MKLVNLFIGQKRFIPENFKSFVNLQPNLTKDCYNFFILWDDQIIEKKNCIFLSNKLTNFRYRIIKTKDFKEKNKKIIQKIKINKYLKYEEKKQLIGWLSQYFILKKSFDFARKILGKKSEKFFWQRLRTDNFVPFKLNYLSIIKNKKMLHFPGANFGFGINDFHCIGDYKNFKIYSNLIEVLIKLIDNNLYVPPEIMLKIGLTQKKVAFTLNKNLPASLIKYNNNKIKFKTYNFRTKASQFICFSFSNYTYINKKKGTSDSFLKTIILKFKFLTIDIFYFFLLKIKMINNNDKIFH